MLSTYSVTVVDFVARWSGCFISNGGHVFEHNNIYRAHVLLLYRSGFLLKSEVLEYMENIFSIASEDPNQSNF